MRTVEGLTINMASSDFFECRRHHTRMLKIRCMQRQEKALTGGDPVLWTMGGGIQAPDFSACADCQEGKLVRADLEKRGAGMAEPIIITTISERSTEMIETKVCKKCGVEKPLTDFPTCKLTNDGREGKCRVCKKARAKELRLEKKKKATEGNAPIEKVIKKTPHSVSHPHPRREAKGPKPAPASLTALDALNVLAPICIQAEVNMAKWGLQDVETLGLALAEECGEVCQAILQARDENGDRERIQHEAVDLAALCVQVIVRTRRTL